MPIHTLPFSQIPLRYYLIAGEASGDLHASNLIRELRKLDGAADIRAWGGDKMEAAGATIVRHYRDLAFMGFIEVLQNLRTILRNIDFCKKDIAAYRPDVLVLVDYPGFNLRIAEWAKGHGMKVVYYISPQVWAWKEGRVKKIRRVVDEMLVILPFEVPFYQQWNYPVTYVGHPLIEVVERAMEEPLRPLTERPVVALLPGSRSQEIRAKLPVMLKMVAHFPDYQFVVAGAPAQPDSLYEALIGSEAVKLVRNDTYNLLRQAKAALVTSGTATLETALFEVPQVVCYRGSPVSYWLAKRLVKIKYISLVNLIMDRRVVPELIQDDLNEETLLSELQPLLTQSKSRSAQLADYKLLKDLLKGENASKSVAAKVFSWAQC